MKVFKNDAVKKGVYDSYDKLLALWGVEYEEIDLDTTYGKTHVIISGNKENPPLLLFHGVGDNSAVMWYFNMKDFIKHFYCMAVDTLGGPGKSVPNDGLTKNSFSQIGWINQVVSKLGIHDFNIAGVSNGAVMAYNYTVNESQKVHKTVCMEGGMVTNPYKTMFSTMLKVFPEILIPTRKNLIKIMMKMGAARNSDIFDKHHEITDHLILLMKSSNQMAMTIHKLEKYDKEKAVAIRDKLYFLFGDHKAADRKDYYKLLDDAELKYRIVENASHGINFDQPAIIESELVKFMLE
jgi:Predicted hydrolases or acyltransferases (alpha/beta hydrolase superfamily)